MTGDVTGRNRDVGRIALYSAIFALIAALVLVVWFQSGDGVPSASAEQETVLAELEAAAEPQNRTALQDGGIEPPQPDATEDFPAATTDAIRDEADRETPLPLIFTIVEELSHDTAAFTQGLEIEDGRLYESTGLVGRSSIRELDITSGQVIRSLDVPDVFAEGLTVVDDTAIQITWQDEIAYRRNLSDFEIIETYEYEGQGWGLCHDGDQLVMSDGTSTLDFRDPDTFEVQSSIDVTFAGEPLEMLNELECVNGTVWANIWLSSLIVEIDPATGEVIGVLNATSLTPPSVNERDGAVLNGIAYDPSSDTFLLTGKLWPTIFRVQIQSGAE